MNYIYDITINLNEELYNFYEWESDDNIEFYLKIPIFKVEKETMIDFISSNFIVDKQFLNRIANKSEIYGKRNNKNQNLCAFVGENKVVVVLFDEKGNNIKKSFLSIDEEEDIIEYSKVIKYSLVDYKITEKKVTNFYLTRNEFNAKNQLLKKLKKIYNNKEYSKLKYIFYEVYNEKNDDEKLIYSKLKSIIENNSEKMNIILNIFNNIKSTKKSIV